MPRPKKTDAKPTEKSTIFEVQKRVNTVYKMLLLGVSRADICEYALTNWNISDGQTDRYIADANDVFKTQSQYIRDDEFGKALSRLQNLYEKNMKIQDYKAALATQKEINTLIGLYPAAKHEHTGKDGAPIETRNTTVVVNAENAHDAGNILKQLAILGAIPPEPSASDNNTAPE
jgi:hypothetical protein